MKYMTDIMIQTKTIENIINNVVISIVSFIYNFILSQDRKMYFLLSFFIAIFENVNIYN
ncbi:hypothetical protein K180097E11_33840 [Phocaeicola dorei]